MYAASRVADTYRQTQVQSRTPLELVVMLYDGALQFMAAAQEAVARRDIPARKTALSKSLAIISELQSTLNMDQGGEIAESLDHLYRWANLRLLDAALAQRRRADSRRCHGCSERSATAGAGSPRTAAWACDPG